MSTATMPTPGTLADSAQALLDSRLDTIERMLLGQVARADRLAIVRDVEAQIHDLLAERNPDDTDRDAVIAVLARLDPPEAYLSDRSDEAVRTRGATSRPITPVARPSRSPVPVDESPIIGKAGGVLGLVAICLALLSSLAGGFAFVSDNELIILAATSIDLVAGMTGLQAIIFAGCARLKGHWSIVGLTTGIMAMLICTLGVGYVVHVYLS